MSPSLRRLIQAAVPPAMMTDEYLWATPQLGVPAVKRPPKDPR